MLKRMKRRWRVCSPCSWSGSAWFWDSLTESLLFQDISTGALMMPTTMMMTRRGRGRSPCSSRGSRRSRPGSPPSSQTLPAEVCKIKVILGSFSNWLESGCHLQFQEQAGWGTRLDHLGMGTKSSLYKIRLSLHDLRVALLHHRVDHVDKGGGASHDHLRQPLGYLPTIYLEWSKCSFD